MARPGACTILMRAADANLAPIRDRMPVILDAEEREAWLARSDDLGFGTRNLLQQQPVAPFRLTDKGESLIL